MFGVRPCVYVEELLFLDECFHFIVICLVAILWEIAVLLASAHVCFFVEYMYSKL